MNMTPSDIRKQEFEKAFRGFDPEAVQAFLLEVASSLEAVLKENSDLAQELAKLESQAREYRSVERMLQQTLLQAQETTDRTLEKARREAEDALQDARRKASEIVEGARTEVVTVREQITILKAKRDSILTRLRVLLQSELEFLKLLEQDEHASSPGKEPSLAAADAFKSEIGDILRSLDQA